MAERWFNSHVLMNFMESRNGWRVSFTEADCQTSLPRKFMFAGPDKIRIMHQRFGSQLLDDKNALVHGISIGRGGTWLTLTDEQYEKLKTTDAHHNDWAH